jgi:hypothetical protein
MKKRKDDDLAKLFKAKAIPEEPLDPEREARELQRFQEARRRENIKPRRERQERDDGGERGR